MDELEPELDDLNDDDSLPEDDEDPIPDEGEPEES